MKYGNPNFLEPSGPLQACNGTDLPLRSVATYNIFKLIFYSAGSIYNIINQKLSTMLKVKRSREKPETK